MNSDTAENLAFGVVFLVIVFILIAGAFKLDEMTCMNKWDNSGMFAKYTILGGCVVSDKENGPFVPSENFRVL